MKEIQTNCHYVVIDGLTGYAEGLELQQKAKELVKGGASDCILILLEHRPVFSIGKAGGGENILMSEPFLKEKGIDIFQSDRGGNVTYHGPGQLVGYPIMNLKKFKTDVHWYFFQLEQVIIDTLRESAVEGGRKEKYPGAWVGDRKIAAVGVHISRWITSHGFSYNVNVNKEHFRYINPCGITEFGIASLDDFVQADLRRERTRIKGNFQRVFGVELKELKTLD